MSIFSNAYRLLPSFKGKKRLGKYLFRNQINTSHDSPIKCRNGQSFYIINTHDSTGRDLFFDGCYEPKTVNRIMDCLDEGGVMIDAGANIGGISLPIAQRRSVKVFAFEPARNIFAVLEKNIALNHLENVEASYFALSDKAGTVDFYESDRVHGWSGIVKIDSFRHYTIHATTLDDFIKINRLNKIKVLKADVQGWEYFVFKGAERLIDEKRIENIIFEFEWWAEKNAGLEIGSAQKYLMEKGFSLFTLEGEPIHIPLDSGRCLIHATIK